MKGSKRKIVNGQIFEKAANFGAYEEGDSGVDSVRLNQGPGKHVKSGFSKLVQGNKFVDSG